MPEIAEVARAVYFLREHLVGKTLASVRAVDDANVFGKVGTSGAEIEKQLAGKTVVGAGQQGKYFWLLMSSPPHLVMHLGMTGWVYLRHIPTAYFRRAKPEDYPLQEWPPKAWRFALATATTPPIEAAFVDSRRFGRVRLVDAPAADIRAVEPLSANGPDPVIDAATVTREWLRAGVGRRQVPIKALLLDQAFLSGVGNWVGDEVLFHAGIHPEQVAASLGAADVKRLHEALIYVTATAVEALANGEPQVPDEERFPSHWLFRHRWGKGRKDAPNRMPDGSRITFVTVGGRTSAVVEGKQKLVKKPKEEDDTEEEATPEAAEAEPESEEEESLPTKSRKRKAATDVQGTAKKRATSKAQAEEAADDDGEPTSTTVKTPKPKASSATNGTKMQTTSSGKHSPKEPTKSRSKKATADRQQEAAQGGSEGKTATKGSRDKKRAEGVSPAQPRSAATTPKAAAATANGKSRIKAEVEATGRRRSGRLSGRNDS